jgi:hypothetical protein
MPPKGATVGPSVLFAICFAKNDTFFGQREMQQKWCCCGEARHPLCSLENYHKWSENLAKISTHKWRNRQALKV